MKTRTSILALTAMLAFVLVGCGDPVPQDYKPEIVVEGYLYVDQPIRGIRVYNTLPVTDTFTFAKAMIRDAQITLIGPDGPIDVVYVPDSTGGRFNAVDTTILVQPAATYSLTVKANGQTLTGVTITPKRFSWITPPKPQLIFPGIGSETAFQDSLILRWSTDAGVNQWLIAVTCEDTLGYGAYLSPPTSDTNRRIREKEFDDGTPFSKETSRVFFIQFNQSPTAWQAFKWYGKHRVDIFAPDPNLFEWYKATRLSGSNYNPLLGSIKGGLGVFGSAYVISAPTFLQKEVVK